MHTPAASGAPRAVTWMPQLTWQLCVVLGLVGQVQPRDVDAQPQPRHLVVDLEVDGLVWLDTDDLQQSARGADSCQSLAKEN